MMSHSDIAAMTNEQLLAEYDRLWRATMSFMAAEGNWGSERKDREEVKENFFAVEAEVVARDLQ